MVGRKIILGLIKAAFIGAVFWWLIARGHLDLTFLGDLSLSGIPYLALGALCVFGAMLAQVVRTRVLFDAQGFDVPWREFVRISWISFFFAAFMPGGVTSDIVRYGYFQKHVKKSRTIMATTVLMDRYLGIAALTLILFVNASIIISRADGGNPRLTMLYLVIVGMLASFVFMIAAMLNPKGHAWLLKRKIGSWAIVRNLIEAAANFRRRRRALLWAFALGLAAHAFGLAAPFALQYFLYPQALFGFGVIAIVFPFGIFASMIPISPMGMGLSQLAVLTVAAGILVGPTAELVTLYTAGQVLFLLCFLTGAIPYLKGT